MDIDFTYKIVKPDTALADFVESFWILANQSETGKEIVVLPDGRIDIFLSQTATDPFHVTLMGLENEATQTVFAPKTIMFAISFKLLAIEYILKTSIADLLNKGRSLPIDFWDFKPDDLNDFDSFCNKASAKIKELIKEEIDPRKQKLFQLIYSSSGSISVKDLAEQVGWSSRQINRYFNEHFGISLKAYCTVLRFRSSITHIKEGKLFPEQNFTDQAHFIKEIKKFSGVAPKELNKNKNDRFIQFWTLSKK